MVSQRNGGTTLLQAFADKHGLKPETVIEAHLDNITPFSAKKRGFSIPSDGILIPYYGLDGKPLKDDLGNDAARVRVLNPAPDEPKYKSRPEAGTQLYIPHGLDDLLKSDTLIITEGEMKALAGVQAGIPVVGLQGCHCWHDSEKWRAYREECEERFRPEDPISMTTPLNKLFRDLIVRPDGSTRIVVVLGDSDLQWKSSASGAKDSLYIFRNAIALQLGAPAVVSFCPPVCERVWVEANRDAILEALKGEGRAAEKRVAQVEQLIDESLAGKIRSLRALAEVLERYAPALYEGLKSAKTGLDDWILHSDKWQGKPIRRHLQSVAANASAAIEVEYVPGRPDVLLPIIRTAMGSGHKLDIFSVDSVPSILEYTTGDPGAPPRIRPLASPAMLAEHIARRVHLFQMSKSGLKTIEIPAKYAEVIFNTVEYTDPDGRKVPLFRPLKGIRTMPVVHPDGSITAYRDGYHDGYIWHIPRLDDILRRVPERPAKEDVQKAVNLLFEPFRETPFADAASVSTFFELMLTMFSRFDIPTAPAFLTTSPAAGTGKTYLASMATYLVYGEMPEAVAWPMGRGGTDDEEVRKLLVTLLLTRPGVILFDNVPSGSSLASSPLEAAITARRIKGRRLGVHQLISVSTTTTLIFTGNNVSLSGDSSSRFQYIRLNAELEDAHVRAFERDEDDWMQWADAHRPAIIAAFLTILRAFAQSGKLKELTKGLSRQSRFKVWQSKTRLVVIWIGSLGIGPANRPFVDPETSVTTHNIDPSFEIEARIVHSLHAVFGTQPFLVRDITAIARKDTKTDAEQELLDALGLDDRRGHGATVRIGSRLLRFIDRWYRGLSLQSPGTDRYSHATLYQIVDHRSDPQGPQGPSGGPDGSLNKPAMPTTPTPQEEPHEATHNGGNGHKPETEKAIYKEPQQTQKETAMKPQEARQDAQMDVSVQPPPQIPDDFPNWTTADYGERILGVPRGQGLNIAPWLKAISTTPAGERLGVFWILCFMACKEWHTKKPAAKAIPLSQLYDSLRGPKFRLFSTEDHTHNLTRLMVWIKALRNIPAPGWYEVIYANPDDPIQRSMALHEQSDVIPPEDQHFRWLLVRWRKAKNNQS